MSTLQLRSKLSKSLFLLPALLVYVSIIVLPSLHSLYISAFRWDGLGRKLFVGLDNYINLITDDHVFLMATRNNLVWTFLTIVFTVFVSLMLATLLNREFIGRTLFRGIMYFPFILSGIVVALVWRWIYHPQLGFLNAFLQMLGLEDLTRAWLSDPGIALYAVYVSALWRGVGGPMILFLAGLQTIPRECLEAAAIDGSGRLSTFIRIIIPMLRETFVVVLATQVIAALSVFDIIYAMTLGGPANSTQTIATWMYQQTFMFANLGIGAAISWIMVAVFSIIIIPYVMFMAKD